MTIYQLFFAFLKHVNFNTNSHRLVLITANFWGRTKKDIPTLRANGEK